MAPYHYKSWICVNQKDFSTLKILSNSYFFKIDNYGKNLSQANEIVTKTPIDIINFSFFICWMEEWKDSHANNKIEPKTILLFIMLFHYFITIENHCYQSRSLFSFKRYFYALLLKMGLFPTHIYAFFCLNEETKIKSVNLEKYFFSHDETQQKLPFFITHQLERFMIEFSINSFFKFNNKGKDLIDVGYDKHVRNFYPEETHIFLIKNNIGSSYSKMKNSRNTFFNDLNEIEKILNNFYLIYVY